MIDEEWYLLETNMFISFDFGGIALSVTSKHTQKNTLV